MFLRNYITFKIVTCRTTHQSNLLHLPRVMKLECTKRSFFYNGCLVYNLDQRKVTSICVNCPLSRYLFNYMTFCDVDILHVLLSSYLSFAKFEYGLNPLAWFCGSVFSEEVFPCQGKTTIEHAEECTSVSLIL